MSEDHDLLDCEDEAARLLPWFVSGTLSAEERARMQAHLAQCPRCSADAAREQRLRQLMTQEPAVEYAPQPGLQQLLTRIDELERELPAPSAVGAALAPRRASHRPRSPAVRWLAAAVVIQTIGLILLGGLLWKQADAQWVAPRFVTLSSAAPDTAGLARVRAVFAPGMTVGELKSLLSSVRATVVAGPSDAGVYTLALADRHASVDESLGHLRAHAGVLFAEPQSGARVPQ